MPRRDPGAEDGVTDPREMLAREEVLRHRDLWNNPLGARRNAGFPRSVVVVRTDYAVVSPAEASAALRALGDANAAQTVKAPPPDKFVWVVYVMQRSHWVWLQDVRETLADYG
jgi:hypothetical protein